MRKISVLLSLYMFFCSQKSFVLDEVPLVILESEFKNLLMPLRLQVKLSIAVPILTPQKVDT